jgi:hypothetical protein
MVDPKRFGSCDTTPILLRNQGTLSLQMSTPSSKTCEVTDVSCIVQYLKYTCFNKSHAAAFLEVTGLVKNMMVPLTKVVIDGGYTQVWFL